jgi:transposase
MQASTLGPRTAGHCGTIFVAIELSQKSRLVTLHSPDRDRVSRHKLDGGDHGGLLELIQKVCTRVTEKLGSAPAATGLARLAGAATRLAGSARLAASFGRSEARARAADAGA